MKATMRDIAEKLGISINAVSLALNNKAGVSDEMRMKILRTADAMGYLSKKEKYAHTFSSSNLCVMMQRIYSTDMNFYGKVLYALTEEAQKSGFDTLMSFFDDELFAVPGAVENHRVSGVIVIGKISDRNIERLQEYNLPLVLVDHASLRNRVDSILTDNKLGGFVATSYLADRGFRRIGYFGDLDYSLSIKERFFGFQEAVQTRGLAEGEGLSAYVKRYSITRDVERWILKNDNTGIIAHLKAAGELPEAFVCSNDKAAIAMLMSLQAIGRRVPEDVSIIGFDNIDICRKVSPKITTLKVDKEAMGRRAVQRIRYRLSHRDAPPENAVLSVELIERQSVGQSGPDQKEERI